MSIGYDFSDDEEVLREQREDAKRAEEWDSLDEKEMAGELNVLNSKVSACALQVSRMMADNDYTKTKDQLGALLIKDLGADGWICSFYNANKEVFGKSAPGTRPDWVNGLKPEEIKLFDAALKYYLDIKHLLTIRSSIYIMLQKLRLADGFRLMRVKENFESAGFDIGLYNRINADVQRISDFLNRSWSDLEKNAPYSGRFLEENLSKLPKGELEKRYRAERISDFQSLVRSCGLTDSFDERSDGAYSPKADLLVKMAVIDRYTYKVSQTEDLKDAMTMTIEACKKIIAEDIAEAEKHCTTQAAQFLCAAFQALAEAVSAFAQASLDAYVSFKEAKAEAPYCFMKKLSSASSAKPIYSFAPFSSDPWEDGTYYKDMYQGAAKALGTQARLYAYDHGATFA